MKSLKPSSPHRLEQIGVVFLFVLVFIIGWVGSIYMNVKNAEGSASAFGSKVLRLQSSRASCATGVSKEGYLTCTVSGEQGVISEKTYSVMCPSMWNFHFGCKLGANNIQGG